MIGRTLSKRVQKLEARLIPTDEPMVIQMMYVSLRTEPVRLDRGSHVGALRRRISAQAQSTINRNH
jgi:hypothetical protein